MLRIRGEFERFEHSFSAPGWRPAGALAAAVRALDRTARADRAAARTHAGGAPERVGRAARRRARAEHRDPRRTRRAGAACGPGADLRPRPAVPRRNRRVRTPRPSSLPRAAVHGSLARIGQPLSQQAPHSENEFRRATQGLSCFVTLVDWPLAASSRRNGNCHMSTEDLDTSSPNVDSAPSKPVPKTHPAPPMLWMLLPVALLALMAFLSR